MEEVLQAVGNAVKQCRGHSRFRRTAVRFIFSTDKFPAHPQWTCVEWAAKNTLTVASVTIYYETGQYPNFCLPSPFTLIFSKSSPYFSAVLVLDYTVSSVDLWIKISKGVCSHKGFKQVPIVGGCRI